MRIEIEVSPGELFDRLTINRLRLERATKEHRASVASALAHLEAAARTLEGSSASTSAFEFLRRCNRMLWRLEDDLRRLERQVNFGPRFITTARLIARLNDKRAAARREVNALYGCTGQDWKLYSS